MYKDILLAVDINDPEDQMKAVNTAAEYAKAFGSTLHVMTVVPDYGMAIVGAYFPEDHEEKAMARAKENLHAFCEKNLPEGIEVQHIVGHGRIYQEVLRYAKEVSADLVVMASHKPGLEDYLVGPNAERVMRHADCSVLVVRP
jgi:nucleotide-binding universal stress UspA family protein